jgi:hypothetical protein
MARFIGVILGAGARALSAVKHPITKDDLVDVRYGFILLKNSGQFAEASNLIRF